MSTSARSHSRTISASHHVEETAMSASQPPATPDNLHTQQSHEIQLRYKLAQSTFKVLCAIPKAPTRQQVLRNACLATEFRSYPIQQAEKSFLRELNTNTAIPYLLTEQITQPWHKVFLLVQANLLQNGWPNKISAAARKSLHQENGRIQALLDKVLRCMVDIYGERLDGRGVSVTLDVLRSLKAGVWEGSGADLLQVPGIGPAKMQKLVDAGVRSIKRLSRLEFYHIERLLSRNPPFGQQLLHQLASFPKLAVNFDIVSQHESSLASSSDAFTPQTQTSNLISSLHQTWVARLILGYENEELPVWKKRHPWVTVVVEGEDGRLAWFWRGSIKRLTRGKELVFALKAQKGEDVKLTAACEDIAGTLTQITSKVR